MRDYDAWIKKCEEIKVCPYYLGKEEAENAAFGGGGDSSSQEKKVAVAYDVDDDGYGAPDVAMTSRGPPPALILSPYNYVLNPSLRPPCLENATVIFDEGHNLSSSCSDSSSVEMSTALSALAVRELDAVIKYVEESKNAGGLGASAVRNLAILKDLVLKFESAITKAQQGSAPGEAWLRILGCAGITLESSKVLVKMLGDVVDHGRSSLDQPARWTGLEALKSCVSLTFSPGTPAQLERQAYDYATITTADAKVKNVRYACLTPSICLREVSALSSRIIVTSGTLSPLEATAVELGLTFKHVLQGKHVVPGRNLYVGAMGTGIRKKRLLNTFSRREEPEQVKEVRIRQPEEKNERRKS